MSQDEQDRSGQNLPATGQEGTSPEADKLRLALQTLSAITQLPETSPDENVSIATIAGYSLQEVRQAYSVVAQTILDTLPVDPTLKRPGTKVARKSAPSEAGLPDVLTLTIDYDDFPKNEAPKSIRMMLLNDAKIHVLANMFLGQKDPTEDDKKLTAYEDVRGIPQKRLYQPTDSCYGTIFYLNRFQQTDMCFL